VCLLVEDEIFFVREEKYVCDAIWLLEDFFNGFALIRVDYRRVVVLEEGLTFFFANCKL